MIILPPPSIVWTTTVPINCTAYMPGKPVPGTDFETTGGYVDGTVEAFHKHANGDLDALYACFEWDQIQHLPSGSIYGVYFVDPEYPNIIMDAPDD